MTIGSSRESSSPSSAPSELPSSFPTSNRSAQALDETSRRGGPSAALCPFRLFNARRWNREGAASPSNHASAPGHSRSASSNSPQHAKNCPGFATSTGIDNKESHPELPTRSE